MAIRKKQPRILRGEEREEFFAAFSSNGELPPRWKMAHRDWLLLRLQDEAGLRCAEACSLQPEHFYPTRCQLEVRSGKGARDRTLGLGRELSEPLQGWMARREEEYPESRWLFPTATGGRVHPSHLRRKVKEKAKEAGLREADRLHPHALRHGFAVRMRENGARLEEVQRALGHERLATTETYLAGLNVDHVEVMQRVADGREKEAVKEAASLASLGEKELREALVRAREVAS